MQRATNIIESGGGIRHWYQVRFLLWLMHGGEFENPEERERPPLEALIEGQCKTD
jgi:hypothetical protein